MNNRYLILVSLLLINSVTLAKESTSTTPPSEKSAATTSPSTSPAVTESDAAILEQGKQLHNANCISCHDISVYTRKNRMIKGYESLKTQVQRCATNLNKPWFDDEVDAVAAYLNVNFYQFKLEKSPQSNMTE